MNSEELEQSLRTEFESYLKEISAGMRQEIVEFQQKIDAEVERHKSQLAEVFEDFSARSEKDAELGAGFRDSVVEHLRLARDEGARITATAFAEAEEMAKETAAADTAANAAKAAAAAAAAAAVPSVGIGELRDGINDISSQTSQAAILKTLVQHAGQFTPRGAFFIIKNEHFVGWRVFGKEAEDLPETEAAVREIFFPLSAETTLGESVKSLNAVQSSYGTNADDAGFLNKLNFGKPEKMFAVPLVARGRGVAVLYADGGAQQGEEANIEALETLVRVAGLTVEVMAATGGATKVRQAEKSTSAEKMKTADFKEQDDAGSAEDSQFAESGQSEDEPQPVAETDSSADAESNQIANQFDYPTPVEDEYLSAAQAEFQPADVGGESEIVSDEYAARKDFSTDDYAVKEAAEETVSDESEVQSEESALIYQAEQPESPESYSWNQPAADASVEDFTQSYQPPTDVQDEAETYLPNVDAKNDYSAPAGGTNEFQFEASQPFEPTPNQFEDAPPSFDSSAFEAAQNFTPTQEEIGDSFQTQNGAATNDNFSFKPIVETVAEPAAAATTKPVRSRFSDKNVDLPIEVSEDERRLHNDARRFARLLVSEIKLYNEQKVKEGRDGSDLYERLREAIDRSREMYDKRIQPPVAAKFDYFHYELVNTLADGSEAKLGADYPGAAV